MPHAGNSLLQTSHENLLVDRVGEPGVRQRTSGHSSINTDAAAGGDTSGEVSRDCENLAGVVREVGLDRRSTRARSALSLGGAMR
jgi:hypothetical protein